MARRLVLLLTILLSTSAPAEYRVFVLRIEKAAPPAEPGQPPSPPNARFVESTLDPEQYRGYYPVADDETVTYVDTWRCRGRTDHRPHCPNPRTPASTEDQPPELPPSEGPDSPAPAVRP